MIKTAQRKVLRFIVQTKGNINRKKLQWTKKTMKPKKLKTKTKRVATDKETEEGSEQSSNKDQDSDLSCREDVDEEIDATENEEEWIETFFSKKKKYQRNWIKYGKTMNSMLDWNTRKIEVANGKKK